MHHQVPRVPISVLIVEDDAVTRRTLTLAIESEPSLKLAAALATVQAALAWLKNSTVDILMTDLGLPDGSGLEVIRACLERSPCCDVMVLTMSSDEDNILACIEAGASGYVLKSAGRLDVVRALLDLHAGGSPMSPLIARKVLSQIRDNKNGQEKAVPNEPTSALLTPREAAILDLIARGDTYSEVARLLSVSVGTVQTHVKNIYGKLAVHSRGEAVFEAQRRGLLHMGLLKSR